jgi:hypothetical protein
MAATHRRLTKTFIELMDRLDAWPPAKRFEPWMRRNAEGIRNGVYSSMKKGLTFDPRYAVGLAEYLIRLSAAEPRNTSAKAFVEYMESVGGRNPTDKSPCNVAELLLEKDERDYFSRGHAGILDAFRGKKLIESYVQGATGEDQVRAAVQWLYVWAAQEQSQRPIAMLVESAVAATESAIRLPIGHFENQAVRWWCYDPWTVILARGKRSPTGMSIVLPLHQESYESIRRGERSLEDIQPADLLRPSRYLYLVAFAQRPEILGGDEGNTTRNVLAAFFSQASILSSRDGGRATDPLHLLAASGTPENAQRLETMRYKPTGTKTRRQGLPLYEHVYDWPMSLDDMLVIGLSTMIGGYADRFLQPPNHAP